MSSTSMLRALLATTVLSFTVSVAPVLAQALETPSPKPAAEAKKETKAESKKEAKPAATPAEDKTATTAVGIAQSPWTKVCGKAPGAEKETCLTGQEVRSDQGAFLASIAVEEAPTENKKVIRVAVPVGLLIQPGLILRADDQKGIPARFTVCLPNACFASIDSANDIVAQMKKGKNLLIAGRNMQGKEINISMPLSGFGTALEGAALDTKALEDQQKKLQDSLQKKAEEERKKLLEKPAEKK